MNKKNSSSPTFKEEKKLWKQGIKYVIGVDEVGRGAFAGPVTVAAVIFPNTLQDSTLSASTRSNLVEVNDSKMLSAKLREKLSPLIKRGSIYSISTVSVKIINKVGIGKATEIAFRKAIIKIIKKNNKKLLEITRPERSRRGNLKLEISEQYFVLVDGFHIKYVKGIGLKNQKAIIKGDKKSFSIAAASIIAKVHRDNMMVKLSARYSDYGFEKHKGYGTKLHRDKIIKVGLTSLHRTAFCNTFLKKNESS